MSETTLSQVEIKSSFWYGGVEFIKYGNSYQVLESPPEAMCPCLIKDQRVMFYISECALVQELPLNKDTDIDMARGYKWQFSMGDSNWTSPADEVYNQMTFEDYKEKMTDMGFTHVRQTFYS